MSRAYGVEQLRHFFHCWQETNNSASSVAGQGCRITLAAKQRPEQDQLAYYRIVDNLQRIVDEDLGAHGEAMHGELYYRMATAICGDDLWMSKKYSSEPAREFRAFMLARRLRDRSLLNGLLFTLIHEVFTHGEVELIHPMFQDWLPTRLDIPKKNAGKILAWITVHTGGLEAEHFGHAASAVLDYSRASGEPIDPAAAKELFKTYLRNKAAVMAELLHSLLTSEPN